MGSGPGCDPEVQREHLWTKEGELGNMAPIVIQLPRLAELGGGEPAIRAGPAL